MDLRVIGSVACRYVHDIREHVDALYSGKTPDAKFFSEGLLDEAAWQWSGPGPVRDALWHLQQVGEFVREWMPYAKVTRDEVPGGFRRVLSWQGRLPPNRVGVAQAWMRLPNLFSELDGILATLREHCSPAMSIL